MQYKRVLYFPGDRNYPEAPFNYNQNVSDSIVSIDTRINTASKVISDSITNSEIISESRVRVVNISELISLSDTVIRQVTKSFLESIANTEIMTHLRTSFVSVSDSIANSEVVTKTKSKNVNVSDIIINSELIQKFLNGNPITGWNKIVKPINTLWTKIKKPF